MDDLKAMYESKLNPIYRSWVSFILFVVGVAFYITAIIQKSFTFLWIGTLLLFIYNFILYTELMLRWD